MTIQKPLPQLDYAPPTDPTRRILRNGTFNARDAGGYPTDSEGVRMREMTLFRSDSLAYLDEDDIAEAARVGLRLVVDLRDPHERDHDVDVVLPECSNVSKMLFEGKLVTFPPENYPQLPELYRMLLTTHVAQIVDTLDHIARVLPGAVLVHCTAGKDRTGIVIALLQTIAGVPLDIVLEDYSASELLLAGGFADRVEQLYDRAGVDRRVMGPEPIASPGRYLGDALAAIIDEHGSVEAFLVQQGLSEEAILRIRTGLTVSAGEQ